MKSNIYHSYKTYLKRRKNFVTILITLFITTLSFAQQGINYKAIIKDDLGNVLANTFMNVQFTIHSVNEAGTIVYQEDQTITTDANGLLILIIGADTSPNVGVFDNIDWGADLHFLQTSITYSGGTINFNATEFMAVPYALHAKTAEKANIIGNEVAFDDWDKDATDDFDGQYSSLSGKPTTTISIPAHALTKSPTSLIITDSSLGLQWANSVSSSAIISIRKPDNYNGGGVEFSIFFLVSTASSGDVQFFIRPRSYNHGDTFGDATSIITGGILVSPSTGFGTVYEQKITIPASKLTKDWWYITIQRNNSTFSEDVRVMSTALTYN